MEQTLYDSLEDRSERGPVVVEVSQLDDEQADNFAKSLIVKDPDEKGENKDQERLINLMLSDKTSLANAMADRSLMELGNFMQQYRMILHAIAYHWENGELILNRRSFAKYVSRIMPTKQGIAAYERLFNRIFSDVVDPNDYLMLTETIIANGNVTKANELIRVIIEKDPKHRSNREAIKEIVGGLEDGSLNYPDAFSRLDTMSDRLFNKTDDHSDLVRLDSIPMRSISWLWRDRMPLGNLSMIYGEGGEGKSQIALSIAATVSNGGAFADGTAAPIGEVIIVTGEDSLADTIVPRLHAAGADLSKIGSLSMLTMFRENGEEYQRSFNLADIPTLKAELKKRPQTRLVIIDPIAAFMAGKDSHRDSDVRELLTPLHQVAESFNVAILMIAHCNKGKGIKAMARLSGSAGFINAVRSAFIVATDPNGEGKVMAHVKSNLAKSQPSLAYEVADAKVLTPNGDPIHTSRINWLGVSATTADEAIAAADQVSKPSDEAVEYLQAVLGDGNAKYADDIAKGAKAKGISQATLYRAKNILGVTTARQGYQSKAIWWIPKDGEGDNPPTM